jgi:hypothetical protein
MANWLTAVGGTLYLPTGSHTSSISGYASIYAKANGSVYLKNEQGTESQLDGSQGGESQGGESCVVTVYTSSATYTNSQTGMIRFTVIGAGGGGGSGRRGSPNTQRTGGGAGGGGAWAIATFRASELPASIPIWVGANGVGGANNTGTDANGSTGTTGGESLIGGNGSTSDNNTIMFAFGGAGGPGGTSGNDGSGQSRASSYEGIFEISGNSVNQSLGATTWSPNGTTQNSRTSMTTRGSFGGGISSGNVISGPEGSFAQNGLTFGNPIYIDSGQFGANGQHRFNRRGIFISTGGRGGSANGFPGTGGAGGIASGGGGGGGKSNSDTFSNAGGNGGSGIIIIEHWK